MRVLFSSIPAAGHFYPLVPLGWALRAAGHEVLVATPEDFHAEVEGAGLPAAASSRSVRSEDLVGSMLRMPWKADEIAKADPESSAEQASFARLNESTLDGTLALIERWLPDLVVIEPAARVARLAAARHGVPLVVHPWGMLMPAHLLRAAESARNAVGPLERKLGLRELPDPALLVDVCPPSYQYPDAPPAQRMRYVPYNGQASLPDWVLQPSRKRRACVTLGTLLPRFFEVGPLVGAVVDALTGLGLELVMAMDPRDAAGLRELRGDSLTLRSASWLSLTHTLPGCDVLVHHGGAGSTLTALVHGLPQVVLPRMADHFLNAERVAATGAGLQVPPHDVSAETVAKAVSTVLEDERFRCAARALADENACQPSPADVVPVLEGLAGRHS